MDDQERRDSEAVAQTLLTEARREGFAERTYLTDAQADVAEETLAGQTEFHLTRSGRRITLR